MIDRTSRYHSTSTITVTDAQGESIEVLELREAPEIESVFATTPAPGTRLDHLAHKYYRDPRQFWRICDASEELDPFDVVQPGQPVTIPPNR